MKALIELHFQHEAENVLRSTLPRFIENVLLSTLSYPNETSKECIQFLILWHSSPFDVKSYQSNVNIYALFHWHSSPLHLIYFLMFFISPQKYHVPFLMNVPNEKPFQTIGWTACFFILFITYIVVIHMMYNRVLYIWSWFFPVTVLYMILILPRHCLIYDHDSSPSVPNNTNLKDNWNLSSIQYLELHFNTDLKVNWNISFIQYLEVHFTVHGIFIYITWQFSPYGEEEVLTQKKKTNLNRVSSWFTW